MSFLAYANDALSINQWQNIIDIKCEEFSRCLSTGTNVLDNLNVKSSEFLYAILMQIFLTVGWRLLTFIVLLIRSYER